MRTVFADTPAEEDVVQSLRRYRWNPYNDVNVRTTETLKGLQQFPLPIVSSAVNPWLMENFSPEMLPKHHVHVFIGQLFSKDSRQALAMIARIAGVQMYPVIPIPRRCVFITVAVAADDAPRLLELHKKLRCELSSTGERVLSFLLANDGELCEMTEAICRDPVGRVDHNTRRSAGIPQGPIVIELSQQGSSTRSRSRSPLGSSSSSQYGAHSSADLHSAAEFCSNHGAARCNGRCSRTRPGIH